MKGNSALHWLLLGKEMPAELPCVGDEAGSQTRSSHNIAF